MNMPRATKQTITAAELTRGQKAAATRARNKAQRERMRAWHAANPPPPRDLPEGSPDGLLPILRELVTRARALPRDVPVAPPHPAIARRAAFHVIDGGLA
jgi:hypothetical protein